MQRISPARGTVFATGGEKRLAITLAEPPGLTSIPGGGGKAIDRGGQIPLLLLNTKGLKSGVQVASLGPGSATSPLLPVEALDHKIRLVISDEFWFYYPLNCQQTERIFETNFPESEFFGWLLGEKSFGWQKSIPPKFKEATEERRDDGCCTSLPLILYPENRPFRLEWSKTGGNIHRFCCCCCPSHGIADGWGGCSPTLIFNSLDPPLGGQPLQPFRDQQVFPKNNEIETHPMTHQIDPNSPHPNQLNYPAMPWSLPTTFTTPSMIMYMASGGAAKWMMTSPCLNLHASKQSASCAKKKTKWGSKSWADNKTKRGASREGQSTSFILSMRLLVCDKISAK